MLPRPAPRITSYNVCYTKLLRSDPGAVARAIRPETAIILTETPANPTLKLTDVAAVSEIASGAGVIHAVDNTFLTPYYQRPLELGAVV